ncbi:hypothetical protein BKA64DRAFT_639252 [Cadophora sp. MPI-SDFR-AT-0126]|nr:hypothetical protein BKA64DRAFT_639252 [Leotiomycetes sp. MPI-SDFR-AT-0126]
MLPSNHHAIQRARSNAPSPSPTISTNAKFKSDNAGADSYLDSKQHPNIKVDSSSSSRPQQARYRSNGPSPSPSICAPFIKTENMEPCKPQPKTEPAHEQEGRSRARNIKTPAPRTFRSSAPSPDRSLSMSCTPPTGVVPPASTPLNTMNATLVSSSIHASSSCCSTHETFTATSTSEDSDEDPRDRNAYNPENDHRFRDIYRQSMNSTTKTVSISNPYFHQSKPAPTPFPTASDPHTHNLSLENQNLDHETETAKYAVDKGQNIAEEQQKGVWNPPHAPKAMQSHQITWINDRKVGERINGVQVPIDEYEGQGRGGGNGKGGRKGLSGKLRMGRKGGKKGKKG